MILIAHHIAAITPRGRPHGARGHEFHAPASLGGRHLIPGYGFLGLLVPEAGGFLAEAQAVAGVYLGLRTRDSVDRPFLVVVEQANVGRALFVAVDGVGPAAIRIAVALDPVCQDSEAVCVDSAVVAHAEPQLSAPPGEVCEALVFARFANAKVAVGIVVMYRKGGLATETQLLQAKRESGPSSSQIGPDRYSIAWCSCCPRRFESRRPCYIASVKHIAATMKSWPSSARV